jgi:hypothetical protein
MKRIEFVGLDVHAETIAVAVAEQGGEIGIGQRRTIDSGSALPRFRTFSPGRRAIVRICAQWLPERHLQSKSQRFSIALAKRKVIVRCTRSHERSPRGKRHSRMK